MDAKRGEHRPGWDLTLSTPKSVSLLALVGGDQRLVEAVGQAYAATLGWVERNLAEARRWNGRAQETVRTGNLVAATFLHDVNRNGEPQLHVHAVVANATRTSDGKWHALKSDELYNCQHIMGAVFNAELRARVDALGYGTMAAQNPRDGAFEIAGVSRAVVEAFSTRSAEIREHLEAHGREGTARERELAALATRQAKTATRDPERRAEAGKGQSAPLVPGREAAVRAQEAARELGLRRLNPGQEAAASLILSSSDRVVNIQGGPGRGKSSVLAPVVAIAKADGRTVIGLAIAGRTARTLAQETGAVSFTVAGFLARHARVIDGTASPMQVERATTEMKGAIVLLDEASQVGTRDMERLVRLANLIEVARLVQVGDTRQLGAVDAGKPFERSQLAGHATAHLGENLRSRSDQMKAVTAALDRGDVSRAFDVLRPAMIEVARDRVPVTAARMWAALPKGDRENTLLLASGRAMRTAANAAAQGELKDAGELGARSVTLSVLDRVTVTREGARQERAYEPGRVVEFRTDLPSQQLARGTRGTVVGVERGQVVLRMVDGSHRLFLPDRLPRNLKQDAVSVYAQKQVELHAGDRIGWTDNDHACDMLNAGLARVEAIGERSVTVSSLVDGTVHELAHSDRMLERLDLAYALNVHAAQGVTTDHGIVMMSAAERRLASEKSFLVAVTPLPIRRRWWSTAGAISSGR